MDIFLMKTPSGSFIPADDEAAEYIKTIKSGEILKAKITRPRNYQFHKKAFALFNLGFEYWEVEEKAYKGKTAVKYANVYRGQVLILAGYYSATYNIDGSVKVIPDSLSFGSMTEDTFAQVYKAVFQVIWKQLLSKSELWTEAELNRVLNNAESFA